jgi:hypothetical protein
MLKPACAKGRKVYLSRSSLVGALLHPSRHFCKQGNKGSSLLEVDAVVIADIGGTLL